MIHIGKAAVQATRTERLAKRNPDRLQNQLDELKALESSGGKLTSHEKSLVEGLEKEIKAVKKAREALGEKAPKFGSGSGSRGGFGGGDRGGRDGGRGGGVLGKRRRDDEGSTDESEIDEETKRIPMPRDTPPPIPKEFLDKWYQKRRERWQANNPDRQSNDRSSGTAANSTPLGDNARKFPDRSGSGNAPKERVLEEVKTIYEAKPALRDLRKEAVAFVPATVRAKMDRSKGVGGLVEPEEADRLEKEGYLATGTTQSTSKIVQMEEVEDEDA